MFKFLRKEYYILFFLGVIIYFMSPFLFRGLLPIPSDTIVGLYNPFRDLYAKDFPRGIPFKNFLITDPVRQQYPWKELSIESISKMTLPLWNPYEMAGKPLLANFQSGTFYPLNIVFLIKPFYLSWSLFIFLQLFLGGIFFYLYSRNLKIYRAPSLMGSISWIFCGFFVAWFQWGNVVHTILWLPLILLSVDKILLHQVLGKRMLWKLILTLSLSASFFAGHLQTFSYLLVFSTVYLVAKIISQKKYKFLLDFTFIFLVYIFITSIQWIPGLQFILQSARGADFKTIINAEWYLPWQHLIQFLAPDFFGNPATLNYWGVWNYAEFVGYVGSLPLLLALFAIFTRCDRKTFFFSMSLFVFLLLTLPTPLAQIPYVLKIPFLATAQPTRLISLICFSLIMLGTLGLDNLIKIESEKRATVKRVGILVFGLFSLVFVGLGWFVKFGSAYTGIAPEFLAVSQRNLFLPILLLVSYLVLFVLAIQISNKKFRYVILALALLIFSFDMVRFSTKFNPNTSKEYLFPTTRTIEFLKKDKSLYRIASADLRILPPNFLTHYKIQSIEGYDPLYLRSYGEFIAALERGKPDVREPFGFNRIITPHRIDSKLMDFLNVKYVFSLFDLKAEGFEKVFEEGETKVYQNSEVYPRIYFVDKVITQKEKQKAIDSVFAEDLRKTAIIDEDAKFSTLKIGEIKNVAYSENTVSFQTENDESGFVVFSDAFYPSWKVQIDGKIDKIYKTDYAFRGVFVPKGKHRVIFYTKLF